MTTPNLFVIGAPKCGTTYLHSVLAQFPDVCMSRIKEPGFFSDDFAYSRGVQHYARTFFSHHEHEDWTGEATPWYLYSSAARERIDDMAGRTAKYIVCLRDPATRAVSMYRDQVRAGYETRSVRQALAVDDTPGHERVEQDYLGGGDYERHLRPWIDTLGKRRVLILLDEDLRDIARLTHALATFLRTRPPDLLDAAALEGNAASGQRSRQLTRFVHMAAHSDARWKRVVRRSLPERAVRRAGEFVMRWNHSTSTGGAPVDEDVLCGLRSYYGSSIVSLESYLGRPLNSWESHPAHSTGR